MAIKIHLEVHDSDNLQLQVQTMLSINYSGFYTIKNKSQYYNDRYKFLLLIIHPIIESIIQPEQISTKV